jgi:hypothetical protein
MIQPCSNQAQNLISGPAANFDTIRPSVGANNVPTSQRSPRGANIKGQFYAVHGRGMSIQSGNNTIDVASVPTKGILQKIYKN